MENNNQLVNMYTQVILQFPVMGLYVCVCTHTGKEGPRYEIIHHPDPYIYEVAL